MRSFNVSAHGLLYYFAIPLSFICCIYMALSGATLHSESALWYFRIIERASFFGKTDGLRWSDFIFQIPTVLTLNAFPQTLPLTVTRILSLSYSLHPFISLFLSYLILRKQRSLHLLPLQIFSLAAVVMPTLSFSTGVVAGAVSFFWPIYFYLNDENLTAARAWVATLTLCLLLAFSHESAVLLLLPLIQKLRLQKRNLKPLILIVPAVTSMWILLHALHPSLNSTANQARFLEGILNSLSGFSYTWVSIATVVIFAVANISSVRPLFPAAAMIAVIALWISPAGRFSLNDARDFRVFITLLTAVIALVPLRASNSAITFMLCISLMSSSLLQVKAAEDWFERIEKTNAALADISEGTCLYAENFNRGVEDVFTSVLLQNTYTPKKLLLPKSRNPECALREKEQNPCIDFVSSPTEFYNECSQVLIQKSSLRFNFTEIRNHR